MKTKVGLLFGGRSVENEISVVTAVQTSESLDADRYEVVPIYISKQGRWYTGDGLLKVENYRDLTRLLASSSEVYMKPLYGDYNLYLNGGGLFGDKVVATLDVILPTLHGTNCEDGTVQGVLASIGIPFVGCGVLASANGMDKITMKMILRGCGIPVVDYFWFNDKSWYADRDKVADALEKTLKYPVIVKPANSGSSVGIRPAHNREEFFEAAEYACTFTTRIIVERLITALKEVNCSVIGNYEECEASVCEVPQRSGEILTYEDKYKGGGKGAKSKGMRSTKRELPAKLADGETEYIQDLACRTFRALSCDGVARIDFMKDEDDRRIYVNEINTIPGSLSSYLWDAAGLPFDKAIDRLIDIALARSREESFKITDFGGNIFKDLGKGARMGKFSK
ncbi:MAG: D-alanine--D-alanine ligase [Bacteroidales bacterium]|nr:D-alanine--D-alanine ligase [Bacteroidales bacterium]